MSGHHATGGRHHRHHPDPVAAAVASHALQPVRTATRWLRWRPEAVILPALALLLAYAEFYAAAVVFGAAGLAALAAVAIRDAARNVGQALEYAAVEAIDHAGEVFR